MQAAQLKELAKDFVSNRMSVARAIREMRDRDPLGFVRATTELLRESPDAPVGRFLLAFVLAQPDGVSMFCDPASFTIDESLGLIQRAKSLDPQVEVKLAKLLLVAPVASERQVSITTRVLEILSRAADHAAILPALRQLLQSPSPRVRSKAALLIGRTCRNPQWARLADPGQDQRVVANAIESLWGLNSNAAKTAFAEVTRDHRNRVAGNGAIGLYLAGEMAGVSQLFAMSRHLEPAFRATAAWSMGRVADPRFIGTLKRLQEDTNPTVQQAARKAEIVLLAEKDRLLKLDSIPLQIRTAKWCAGAYTIGLIVHEGDVSTRGLKPFQFVITSGGEVVEEFAFTELPGPSIHYEFRWSGPLPPSRIVKAELFTEKGAGEAPDLELSV